MPDQPSTERDLMKGYWESYAKWNVDAVNTKTKDLSTARANMAVQGIGSDSPIYQATISRLTQDFENNVASIEAGQTRSSLNKYYEDDKIAYEQFLNREGIFKTNGRGNYKPAEYAGATQEEKDLVAAFDQGEPIKYGRPGTQYSERAAEYDTLLSRRDELIASRQDSSMEDFFTNQFGLDFADPTAPVDVTGSDEDRRRRANANSGSGSPWW